MKTTVVAEEVEKQKGWTAQAQPEERVKMKTKTATKEITQIPNDREFSTKGVYVMSQVG